MWRSFQFVFDQTDDPRSFPPLPAISLEVGRRVRSYGEPSALARAGIGP
jgi:hypothetical protein